MGPAKLLQRNCGHGLSKVKAEPAAAAETGLLANWAHGRRASSSCTLRNLNLTGKLSVSHDGGHYFYNIITNQNDFYFNEILQIILNMILRAQHNLNVAR